ncbi:glucosaminidase domain-containing protein [Vagococcus fluvialis]|uniref:LysM peptidoglycan-binding domain-containing M23 family metallopeptidase n=1 Tax=Vagococcus fluvialis TaxID=2738 RepID=UPI003D153508
MKKKMLIAVVVGTLTSGIVSPIIGYAATNEFVTKESQTETLVTEEEQLSEEETVDTSEEETTISSETEASTETTEEESTTTTESSEIEETTTETSNETTESSTTEGTTSSEEPKKEVVTKPSEVVTPKEPVKEVAPIISEIEQPNTEVSTSEITVVKNQSTEEFIESIGDKAREVGQEYNLYASVMIAQAILETGSGTSKLSQSPNYNLFGIKGSYKGQSANFYTNEDNGKGQLYTIQASFRKYPSYKESFEDYAELLTNEKEGNGRFYKGVLKNNAKDYKEATKFLTGRYATDTQYDQKLNKLIETYDLTFFDKKLEKQGSIQAVYHDVKEKDTIDNLLTEYKITKEELLAWNKTIKEADLLKQSKLVVGQEKVTSYPIRNIKTKQESRFIVPLKEGYVISSPFGDRGAEHHNGIDLAVPENTLIYASSKGKVADKGFDPSAGNYVILEHENGLKTSYFHMNRAVVSLNQTVEMGEMIGFVGSTGNSTGAHLHFAINTELWSGYINPANYLNFK